MIASIIAMSLVGLMWWLVWLKYRNHEDHTNCHISPGGKFAMQIGCRCSPMLNWYGHAWHMDVPVVPHRRCTVHEGDWHVDQGVLYRDRRKA